MKRWLPTVEFLLASMLLLYAAIYGQVEWIIFAIIILCQLCREEIK